MALPRIILFGDSLTQQSFNVEQRGWGAQLADALVRRADVVNRGLSGYNSRWALTALRAMAPASLAALPTAVVILLGSNDCSLPEVFPQQHVPVEEFERNIAAMVQHVRAAGAAHVLLVTPPPLCEATWTRHCQSAGMALNRTNRNTRRYAQAMQRVAAAEAVPLVDLWGGELEARPGDFLEDGLHLGARGNDVLFRGIMDAIERHAPDFAVERLPMLFPAWRDVDPAEPAESLAAAARAAQSAPL